MDELGFCDNGPQNATQQEFWQEIVAIESIIENASKDSQFSHCSAIPREIGETESTQIVPIQRKSFLKQTLEDDPGTDSFGECSRPSAVISLNDKDSKQSIKLDEVDSKEVTAENHKLQSPAENVYGRSTTWSEAMETIESQCRSGRNAKVGGYFTSYTNLEILSSLEIFGATFFTKISWLLIYLTVGIFIRMPFVGVEGGLTSVPANTLFVVGQTARMNCCTNLSRPVFWARTLVGSDDEQWLYYGKSGFDGSNADDRFTMDKDEATGRYDVIITDVQPKDAGQYVCVDDSGIGARGSAEIVVSDPINCNARIPNDGVMGHNVFGLEEDFIQISCSLTYTGNLSPTLKWSWPDSEEESGEPVVCVSASNISSTLKLSPVKERDNVTFQCNAEIESATQRSMESGLHWESETVVVRYAAFASEEVDLCPGVTWNLVCNPPCSYFFEEKVHDCQCLYTYNDTRTQLVYQVASDAVKCDGNNILQIALIAVVVIASFFVSAIIILMFVYMHIFPKMKRRRRECDLEESCRMHGDDSPGRDILELEIKTVQVGLLELPQKSF